MEEKKLFLNQIVINPEFAQRQFSEAELHKEIAQVKAGKAIVPLWVYDNTAGGLEIISGHRRFIIAKYAGLDYVPCFISQALSLPQIRNLQKLDRIHDIGENTILRHPDAYQFYKNNKAILLKRAFPVELQSETAWKIHIKLTLFINMYFKMLTALWNDMPVEFTNWLLQYLSSFQIFQDEIEQIANIFSQESFKVSSIEKYNHRIIKLLNDAFQLAANQNIEWPKELNITLRPTRELTSIITLTEANHIFNIDLEFHLQVYRHQVMRLFKLNENRVIITQKDKVRKVIGANRTFLDPGNLLSLECRSKLLQIVKLKLGEHINTVLQHPDFVDACIVDFQNRLQKICITLYETLYHHNNYVQIIDDGYIDHIISELKFADQTYSMFNISDIPTNPTLAIKTQIINLFQQKMFEAFSNNSKLRYNLRIRSLSTQNDINIVNQLSKIIRNAVLDHRTDIKIRYDFADSPYLTVNSPAELIGTLLLMERSYKHFVKQCVADKKIFLKKRLRFSTIKRYLEKQKAIDISDGLSEFMFTINLNGLGTVSTELKITVNAIRDYHVRLFHSYRKKLTKDEKETVNNNKQNEKSGFIEMATTIIHNNQRELSKTEINYTIASWMSTIMKLEQPNMNDQWSKEEKDKIIRLFRVYVFTLIYIEGTRNPGALVLHPLQLKTVFEKPQIDLDNCITAGKFIMTPKESKAFGENLHRFFAPKSAQDVEYYNFNNPVAVREITALDELKPDLTKVEDQLLDMFNLPASLAKKPQ